MELSVLLKPPFRFLIHKCKFDCSLYAVQLLMYLTRLFLYLILTGALAGVVYFIYVTWIKALFPQQKKRTTRKPAATTDSATASGASKSYDESWIPAQHLQRPEAKRVRSGTPKTKAK